MASELGQVNTNTIILEQSDKGVSNGVAELDANGHVPAGQIAPRTYYEVYGAAVSRSLNQIYSTNVLDTEDPNVSNPSSLFTVSAAGIVTYTGPTISFSIGFFASAVNQTGGTRSTAFHSIFINGAQILKSERYSYHRVNNDGFDSASYEGIFVLNNGDTVELRSRDRVAADTVDMLESKTNMIIKSI